MRIVVGHDNEGQWWWTAISENGTVVAMSVLHASRPECMRSIAELKVEGPVAPVAYDD
ncbi:MAG: YegP family protein [Actinobacteria bacterium]|nr:YegP family protein [Actinomycetota bacterium]